MRHDQTQKNDDAPVINGTDTQSAATSTTAPTGSHQRSWIVGLLKILAFIVLICVGLIELAVYGLLNLSRHPGCDPAVLCEAVSPSGMLRAVARDFVCKDNFEGTEVFIERLREKASPVYVGRINREKGSRKPARVGLHWTSKNTLVVEYANGVKGFEYRKVRVGKERVTVSFVPVEVDAMSPPDAH